MTAKITLPNGKQIAFETFQRKQVERDLSDLYKALEEFGSHPLGDNSSGSIDLLNVRRVIHNNSSWQRQVVYRKMLLQVCQDLYFWSNGSGSYQLNISRAARLFCSMLDKIEGNIGNYKTFESINQQNIGWFIRNRSDFGGQVSRLSEKSLLEFGIKFGYFTKISEAKHYSFSKEYNLCARYQLSDKYSSLKEGETISLRRDKRELGFIEEQISKLSDQEVIRVTSILTTEFSRTLVRRCKNRLKAQKGLKKEWQVLKELEGSETYVNQMNSERDKLDDFYGVTLAQARAILRIQNRDLARIIDSIKYDNYGGRTYDLLSQVKKDHRKGLKVKIGNKVESVVEIDVTEMNLTLAALEYLKNKTTTTLACATKPGRIGNPNYDFQGILSHMDHHTKTREDWLKSKFLKEDGEGCLDIQVEGFKGFKMDVLDNFHSHPQDYQLERYIYNGILREEIAINIEEDYTHHDGWTVPFSRIRDLDDAKKYKDLIKKFMLVGANCLPNNKAARLFNYGLSRINYRFYVYYNRFRQGQIEGMSSQNALKAQQSEVEFMQGRRLVHTPDILDPLYDETDITNYNSYWVVENKGVLDFCIDNHINWFKINHDSIWTTTSNLYKLLKAFESACKVRGFMIDHLHLKVEGITIPGKSEFDVGEYLYKQRKKSLTNIQKAQNEDSYRQLIERFGGSYTKKSPCKVA